MPGQYNCLIIQQSWHSLCFYDVLEAMSGNIGIKHSEILNIGCIEKASSMGTKLVKRLEKKNKIIINN